jgi:hypothetical protein
MGLFLFSLFNSYFLVDTSIRARRRESLLLEGGGLT